MWPCLVIYRRVVDVTLSPQLAPGTDCRKGCLALGTFGLHQLEVDGQMNSDGAMSCRVSLEDCILQDTRPSQCLPPSRDVERLLRSVGDSPASETLLGFQ